MVSEDPPFEDPAEDPAFEETMRSDDQSSPHDFPMPDRIGRYRVVGELGTGGFGAVYRAIDETLQREVAIKVPRRSPTKSGDPLRLNSTWIAEAQVVAGLDHPHIVPVYDVGQTPDYPVYVVSKLISGCNLRRYTDDQSVSPEDAIRWMTSIADALHYAHLNGLVHRDVKPGNILIDDSRHPWLTDFGIALRDADVGKGTVQYIGTFHYMSPEQARGEGHLVDGRADIFSLGIVLYELLTGTRPFGGDSSQELLSNIVRQEARPLRLRAPSLPIEVERICMKALAKRVSDRYTTARDMADDLRRFGHGRSPDIAMDSIRSTVDLHSPTQNNAVMSVPLSVRSASPRIVPKGLRAFDEHDRSFFLKLVPGARDVDGVPETIRQWKFHIESKKPDETFRVGLIYGASGSGKSSLVRAGLIPLLDKNIEIAFVEANLTNTETRLLRALPQAGTSGDGVSLVTRMTLLRQNRAAGRKVLIVLDQFEQWLHAQRDLSNCELIDALRQCDGLHVQCIVLIRDDFWMEATRFFHELDIRLIDGVNSAAVDRFDLRHARFVLTEFGRAYGALPDDSGELSTAQSRFVNQVIEGVQEDGKVICVHLVLLAQMLKGREWIPATLAEFGGTDAIGVDFLEATFTSDTASPLHRSLQQPARAVLNALLPEAGTNIKGQMQSAEELHGASELGERDFGELIDVLDFQLRLITPTVGLDETSTDDSGKYYQLTHDFLVPSLRTWLTQKQRESSAGRARLRQEELSHRYRQKPETRNLPTAFEFVQLAWLTRSAQRSKHESNMMRAAARHHATRWGMAAVMLCALTIGGMSLRNRSLDQARTSEALLLVRQLFNARVGEVPETLRLLEPVTAFARSKLQSVLVSESATDTQRLRARMALLNENPDQAIALAESVPTANTDDLIVLPESLGPHAEVVSRRLWELLESQTIGESAWLQTVYVLARLAPHDPRWQEQSGRVAETIVNQSSMRVSRLAAGFSPLAESLTGPLAAAYSDPAHSYDSRVNAAIVLAACCENRDELLNELVCAALPAQFEILFPIVQSRRDTVLPLLHNELQQQATWKWPRPDNSDGHDMIGTVDDATQRKFAAANGMINESFAICQNLPFAEFESLAGELNPLGYRPEVVRVFRHDERLFVAAIWRRDGRDWRFSSNMKADQVSAATEEMRALGLFPTDLTRIPQGEMVDETDELFGVLWTAPGPNLIDARIYVAVPEWDHESAWGPLNDGGFVPKTNFKFYASNSTAMYSSVRRKMRLHPNYVDAWDDSAYGYTSRILDGWHQVDVRLNSPDATHHDVTYGAVWWNGGPLESRAIDRSSVSEHLSRIEQLAVSGFRPASISVVAGPKGLSAASVWHRGVIEEAARDRVASRQANALIAGFRLGETSELWPHLEHQSDARLRSYLIDRFAVLGVEPDRLIQQLVIADQSRSRKFAIISALSKYRPEQVPGEGLAKLRAAISQLGASDPSAALHSICLFLCRHWKWSELEESLLATDPPTSPDTKLVGRQRSPTGHLFATIHGPVEVTLGSPGNELFRDHGLEVTRRCRIPRSFAIATTEVTVDEFRRYDPDFGYAGDYTPSDRCPINMLNWIQAAKYCRWLCDQENMQDSEIPYPPIDEIRIGMTLPEDFLSRTGYRLPTQAEWEYAARSGTHTSRHFGNDDTLLNDYAWTSANSRYQLYPVGQLMPNDFGLFDVLGNTKELCHDRFRQGFSTTKRVYVDDASDDRIVTEARLIRGGAFLYAPSSARSASLEPVRRSHPYIGFRIARTIRE